MADFRGFLKFQRVEEEKRPIAERVADWRDITVSVSSQQLREQSARCMDCGVPFCQSSQGCPVENLIPDWNDLIHQQRWKEALEALHSTNNFPEFTGKLCPAPCESACVLGAPTVQGDPVSIRNIESGIIERGFEEGWVQPVLPKIRSGKKVAVIGSGPAGLAAAQQLVRAGHSVTVFEKSAKIGGLVRYGIPDFKLEKSMIDRRLEQMVAEGVIFKTGVEVTDREVVDEHVIDIAEIQKNFDAICLTIGAEQPRDLPVPGRNLEGVHFAMDYLTQQNQRSSGDLDTGDTTAVQRLHARGKRVIIIGGGDTGSDCLGTAHRQGCKEVHQFEIMPMPPKLPSNVRHESTPWPFWPLKLRTSHAHEEGGNRRWSVATTEFVGDENRKLTGIKGVEVSRDAKGNFAPVAGTEFEIEVDLVLIAMGFSGVKRQTWLKKLGVALDSRGNIQSDSQYRTNIRGVFAAGDAKRGASLIVWAIAEGRKMAEVVDHFLKAKN